MPRATKAELSKRFRVSGSPSRRWLRVTPESGMMKEKTERVEGLWRWRSMVAAKKQKAPTTMP
jgi:hypothetical protein